MFIGFFKQNMIFTSLEGAFEKFVFHNKITYQEGIWKPRFNVTGMVAAVGQLNCMKGGLKRDVEENP